LIKGDKSRILEIIIQNLIVNLITQTTESMSIAYLLSGSNMGDRAAILESAIAYISDLCGEIILCSDVYESPSWGFEHPTPFLNQAIKLKTDLDPESLIKVLLRIEEMCGRIRSDAEGYEARPLDLDILFYDDDIIHLPELIIPHPRLHLRRFTLGPLSEITVDFVHPVSKKTIAVLLDECQDDGMLKKYSDSKCCQKNKEVRDAV